MHILVYIMIPNGPTEDKQVWPFHGSVIGNQVGDICVSQKGAHGSKGPIAQIMKIIQAKMEGFALSVCEW